MSVALLGLSPSLYSVHVSKCNTNGMHDCSIYICTYTVVWEKLVVGNIHEKKFCGKKFLS